TAGAPAAEDFAFPLRAAVSILRDPDGAIYLRLHHSVCAARSIFFRLPGRLVSRLWHTEGAARGLHGHRPEQIALFECTRGFELHVLLVCQWVAGVRRGNCRANGAALVPDQARAASSACP